MRKMKKYRIKFFPELPFKIIEFDIYYIYTKLWLKHVCVK